MVKIPQQPSSVTLLCELYDSFNRLSIICSISYLHHSHQLFTIDDNNKDSVVFIIIISPSLRFPLN